MPDTGTLSERVLDSLVSAGLVTEEQVRSAEDSASEAGVTPGALLVQRDLLTSVQIANVLEEDLGVPRVDLESYAPDESALKLVPAAVARSRGVLPLFEIEGMLTVAIGDPLDVFELDTMAADLGVEVEAVLTDAPAVGEAIDLYYGAEAPVGSEAPAMPVEEASLETSVEAQFAGAPSEVSQAPTAFEPESGFGGPEFGPAAEWPSGEAESDAGFGVVAADAQSSEADLSVPGLPGLADMLAPGYEEISVADFFEVGEELEAGAEAQTGGFGVPAGVGMSVSATAEVVAEQAGEASEAAEQTPIDLDVLAVADDRKVAVLVADILDYAVEKGATRIHLLPYKAEFFLVFRVQGRLEKVASAPLSLQAALIDGLKSYVHLTQTLQGQPAIGRIRAEIGGKEYLLTTSVVPTLAGQRLVMAIGSVTEPPASLVELGMSEAEERALFAMIERGKGLVLIAAPVGGGRSTTYYALLSHAARAGRISYSVEETVEHEIPSVAQVLVGSGSVVPAAAYFAAGLHQDTDVVAMDPLQTVDDVHLAIEAASRGKLVIATFAGGSIASAVRRMLDLGAEPTSLANALALAVGQRVARVNCPVCSIEMRSELAERIPGAELGMTARSGAGCPECGRTGFRGAVGLFEVLPFTEPVRAAVARSASVEELTAIARSAGMRDMTQAGLDKVKEGLVSPEELDRVLRFSE